VPTISRFNPLALFCWKVSLRSVVKELDISYLMTGSYSRCFHNILVWRESLLVFVTTTTEFRKGQARTIACKVLSSTKALSFVITSVKVGFRCIIPFMRVLFLSTCSDKTGGILRWWLFDHLICRTGSFLRIVGRRIFLDIGRSLSSFLIVVFSNKDYC
jgi:hypothetical protein